MSEISSVELEHCKELAMPPGCLFEVSSRFVGAEMTAQLLALYALRGSISSISLSTADDTVKWAKLKWWSEELCEDANAQERHPVLRALQHSGARQQLSNNMLLGLVSNAVGQIDAFPEADSQALIDSLADTSETDILLQAALSEVVPCEAWLKPMSRAVGTYSLVTMLISDYPNKIQLLPLDWLAEFQVLPENLKGRPPVAELISMIKRLAEQGAESYCLGFEAERAGDKQLGVKEQIPKHLRLRLALEARYLKRVARNAEQYFSPKSTYGLSDVWFSWKLWRKA